MCSWLVETLEDVSQHDEDDGQENDGIHDEDVVEVFLDVGLVVHAMCQTGCGALGRVLFPSVEFPQRKRVAIAAIAWALEVPSSRSALLGVAGRE